MRSILFFVILAVAFLFFGCLSQPEHASLINSTNVSINISQSPSVFYDIQYSTISKTLLLDIYLPENVSTPYPTIIYIHGGGWRHGSKIDCPQEFFVERGYAVACVDYRLSNDMKFPAQIQDVKAAIRWLRANSDKYDLNASSFGVFGDSAGGHLSALVGTSGGVSRFDSSENFQYSGRVQAVVDWFGPVSFIPVENITTTSEPYSDYNSAGEALFGGPIIQNHDMAVEANPAIYASPDDPPFLIMHGTDDTTVPLSESKLLYDALKKQGVDATFVVLNGQGHGFGKSEYGQVVDFFDKILKNKT